MIKRRYDTFLIEKSRRLTWIEPSAVAEGVSCVSRGARAYGNASSHLAVGPGAAGAFAQVDASGVPADVVGGAFAVVETFDSSAEGDGIARVSSETGADRSALDYGAVRVLSARAAARLSR